MTVNSPCLSSMRFSGHLPSALCGEVCPPAPQLAGLRESFSPQLLSPAWFLPRGTAPFAAFANSRETLVCGRLASKSQPLWGAPPKHAPRLKPKPGGVFGVVVWHMLQASGMEWLSFHSLQPPWDSLLSTKRRRFHEVQSDQRGDWTPILETQPWVCQRTESR